MKLLDGWTKEQIKEWLEKGEEPEGCLYCGAVAGACLDYPNCPGAKQEEKKDETAT